MLAKQRLKRLPLMLDRSANFESCFLNAGGGAGQAAVEASAAPAGSEGGAGGSAMRLCDSLMAQHDAVVAHQRLQQEIREEERTKEVRFHAIALFLCALSWNEWGWFDGISLS